MGSAVVFYCDEQSARGAVRAEVMSDDSRPDDHMQQPPDPNLYRAVGGYQSRRRPGWYIALILVGFGLGAVLALAVGHRSPVEHPEAAPGTMALPATEPIRAGIVFSTDKTAPERTPDMIPAGIKTVYCHFRLPGLQQIEGLVATWSQDGKSQGEIPAERITGDVEGGFAIGYVTLEAPSPDGFANGIYEVSIRTPDGVVHESSFVVVQSPDRILSHAIPQAVGVQIANATICEAVTAAGKPEQAQTSFTTDTKKIFLSFSFANAQPGSVVKVQWLYHEQPIASATNEITLETAEGWAYAWIGPNADQAIMPGSYRAVVKSIPDDAPLASVAFVVKASR